MDRREAIKVIGLMKRQLDRDTTIYDGFLFEALAQIVEKQQEALSLAIEALKESQTTHDQMDACFMAQKKALEKLQLTEETSTVSEKESVEGEVESATTTDQKQVTSKLKNPCDSLLKADSDECKEQKSKLDCISRQQAIDGLCQNCEAFDCIVNGSYCGHDCTEVEILRNLPPVTPTERTGEWIESYFNEWCGTDENHNSVFRKTPCVKCTRCGEKRRNEEKFCPNCGAKMGGDTE